MTGIIDIGSNTIRLVVYQDRDRIANFCDYSTILADTVDGNLSKEGIDKLCATLFSLRKEISEYNCGLFAFATSAFRDLKNQEQVKAMIFEKTGLKVDVLSGEKEAEYDFFALTNSLEKDACGIGVDLGGGSCQIFGFENGSRVFSVSLPIGCKRVKRNICKTPIPTDTERIEIERYVNAELAKLPEYDKSKFKNLYMMGGTIKTAGNLQEFLHNIEKKENLTLLQIDELISDIEKSGADIMESILKKRYETITVGLLIAKQIAKFANADRIFIKKCCIRDGYLEMIKGK